MISASGINGPLDMVGQALTALRYTADLSNIFEGPYIAGELRNVIDVVKGVSHVLTTGATGTNTEVYNAIHALTQLVGKPGILSGIVWLANRLPAGPLATLLGTASVVATSPTVTRGFTDWAAGERGTKVKPEPDDPYKLPDLDKLPSLDAEDDAEDKKGGGASGLETLGVGVLDDLLVPALRFVPGAGKALVAGVSGITALGLLLHAGQQYKAEGEPPAKHH